MGNSVDRRLAAILVADVVGSTRLMEADESGTLTALAGLRAGIVEPLVKQHGGRIVKLMGDGLLVEFGSAVSAATCAVAIQDQTGKANLPLPAERQIVLRIGVHLGDVVDDGTDILGDGVNLAAHIQGLAEPGSVCVTSGVHDAIRGKLLVPVEDMGERHVKGSARPIRLFKLTATQTAVPAPRLKLKVGEKPSVALIPFTNASGDPEQNYFADGLSEEATAELSRFRNLLVIAHQSALAFKGRADDLRDVSRKLGARYLVVGSVRKTGRHVRVLAQLVDGETGIQLWADRFQRDAAEIQLIQDELIRTIVSTVGDRVEVATKEKARRLDENELRAFDLFFRAAAAEDANTRTDYAKAADYLRMAIEADPGMAQAHHHLSLVRYIQWMAFWADDRERAFDEAEISSKRALALDGSNSGIRAHHGILLSYRGEYEQGEHQLTRAIDLNPNDSKAHSLYAFFLTASGRAEDAFKSFHIAKQLNPLQPGWTNWLMGISYFTARRYREAIASFSEIALPMNEVRGWLAAAYALDGDRGRAARQLRLFLDQARTEMINPPPETMSAWHPYWRGAIPYRDQADFDHLIDGLRKAGMND